MGKASSPDYGGAAREQAAYQKEANTAATWANRPTVHTPWGDMTWNAQTGIDPATGQQVTDWTQNINLSPEEQAAFESQQAVKTGRSQAAERLLGQATQATQSPFDWDNLPSRPGSIADAQNQSYQTMHAALEPQRQRQQAAQETQLANMGLSMDSQAYKNAQMDLAGQFGAQDRGLLAQAMSQGISDTQAQQALRQSAIGEQQQRRGMPLNELNALLTGQQVGMPQMPSFAQAGTAQAPDLLGAATQQGQFDLANKFDWGAALGGAAQVGSAAMKR